MTRKFDFNKIYVIESLRPGEINTGQSLFNDSIKWGMIKAEFQDDDYHLHLTNTKKDFIDVLIDIENETSNKEIYPIIHLELHGSENGLETGNSEVITWNEITNLIRNININTNNNLFLTMATCYGGYIFKMIKPKERSPFWGFIGAFDELYPDEILMNFTAFYDEFLDKLDINSAVQKLNRSNPNVKSHFRFHNSQFAFEKAYENYEAKYLQPDILELRIKSLIEESKNEKELLAMSLKERENMFRFILKNQNTFIRNEMLDHFLMKDLIEN